MAHDLRGKVWVIDTSATGVVLASSLYLESIIVTWKVASAGSLEFSEVVGEGSAGTRKFLTAETYGASSAGNDQSTQQFEFGIPMQNIWLTTATNIKSCYIVTK